MDMESGKGSKNLTTTKYVILTQVNGDMERQKVMEFMFGAMVIDMKGNGSGV